MSVHALEQVLYDLGTNGEARRRFQREQDAFLSRYAVTEEDTASLTSFDVRAMYDRGVNPMLLQGFWLMLEPSHSIAAFIKRLQNAG